MDPSFAPAKSQNGSAKSPIYAVFRWCYIEDVQNGHLAQAGPQEPRPEPKVCVMSIRYLDQLAPAFLLFLGFIAAGGTAVLGA
jgi:hypothetical protein